MMEKQTFRWIVFYGANIPVAYGPFLSYEDAEAWAHRRFTVGQYKIAQLVTPSLSAIHTTGE
jgi:hypothetical protein